MPARPSHEAGTFAFCFVSWVRTCLLIGGSEKFGTCLEFCVTALLADQGERLLVVAYASAPGLPNWGGLLRKVFEGMAEPAHRCFDTLYVVDPSRSWYHGECFIAL